VEAPEGKSPGELLSRPEILAAVSVSLALEELDRMKAVEQLPTPEALMERMRKRDGDFALLAGIAGAYLHERGLIGGCNE
jgi:hypothetical protein